MDDQFALFLEHLRDVMVAVLRCRTSTTLFMAWGVTASISIEKLCTSQSALVPLLFRAASIQGRTLATMVDTVFAAFSGEKAPCSD